MLEELEGRVLLSGVQTSSPAPAEPAPQTLATLRAAVQSDLQQIKTDQMQLQKDLKALRPQLKADQQAVAAAIDALASTLAPLRQQYQADSATWRSVIQADQQAAALARQAGDAPGLAAAQTALANDRAKQQAVLQADAQQIRQTINNDPVAHGAQVQLAADTAIIQADQEQVCRDYAQLRAHLEQQYAAGGGADSAGAQASRGDAAAE
jgi:hypothetical protein